MPRSWRTPRRWRSVPSSPGVGREVHALPGKGRGPAPRPQLGLLPAVLSLLLPAPGRARDRGRAHVRARRAPPGCGLGREGQPRPLGRARRAGLRHDRALPRARHRTYSELSHAKAVQFAAQRGLPLRVVALEDEAAGLAVPAVAAATRRPPCSACGTMKRHYFDAAALEGGFDVLVTGHNLDDEAARLMGNVLRWQTDH